MKNRMIIILIAVFLSVSCVSCSNSQQNQPQEGIVNVENMPSLQIIQEREEYEDVDKAAKDQMTEESKHFSCITEMFSNLDEAYSTESELYMKAIKAYESQIDVTMAEKMKEAMYDNVGQLRVSFGYVDDDDIPELFIAAETIHVFGVNIYTYDSNSDMVIRLGEFSSFGRLNYVEHRNRIISTYGSQGFYMDVFSAIEDNKPVFIGSVAEYNEELYYARYPMPDGIDGSHKDSYGGLIEGTGPNAVEVEFPEIRDVTYIVSKDEYDQIVVIYENLIPSMEKEIKTVDYDSMYEIEFKDV